MITSLICVLLDTIRSLPVDYSSVNLVTEAAENKKLGSTISQDESFSIRSVMVAAVVAMMNNYSMNSRYEKEIRFV